MRFGWVVLLCAVALARAASGQATLQRDVLRGTVVDPEGKPLPGAIVEVWRRSGEGFSCLDLVYGREHRVVGKMATTKTGSFALHVPLGLSYELHVTKKGYARAVRKWVYAGEEWNIETEPPGTVTGVVTVAGTGEPVAKAVIRAWDGDQLEVFAGHTDEDGRYRFENVRSGGFTMRLSPPKGVSPSWLSLGLEPGETLRRDVELSPGVRLSGKVVDAGTGKPIAAALVGEGWVFNKGVRTDKNGAYVMHDCGTSGYHTIEVLAAGYCKQVVARPKKLTGPIELDFELHKGLVVTGRVLDQAGKPMQDVYVAAVCMGRAAPERSHDWLSDRTKHDGSFRITGLGAPLNHELLVRKDGCATAVYSTSGLGVTPRNGAVWVPDVRLRPARVLSGTVVDGGGKPRPGVTVSLYGANADRSTGLRRGAEKGMAAGRAANTLHDHYLATRKLKTNIHGNFHFADLPPGTYRLQIGRSQGEVFPGIEVTADRDPKPVRCEL
ncbi:MAG: carboxypeptidase regulatory-like domain-containing protein [Planctomycetota bacterium]|jgi:protocatechuate 3,4-dioxygenase beta subunit